MPCNARRSVTAAMFSCTSCEKTGFKRCRTCEPRWKRGESIPDAERVTLREKQMIRDAIAGLGWAARRDEEIRERFPHWDRLCLPGVH